MAAATDKLRHLKGSVKLLSDCLSSSNVSASANTAGAIGVLGIVLPHAVSLQGLPHCSKAQAALYLWILAQNPDRTVSSLL